MKTRSSGDDDIIDRRPKIGKQRSHQAQEMAESGQMDIARELIRNLMPKYQDAALGYRAFPKHG